MKQKNVISQKTLREGAVEFDRKLKELAKEHNISSFIFIGQYKSSTHPNHDEAVSIVAGQLPEVLKIGAAFDDVMAEAVMEFMIKDLQKAAGCETCPDREDCQADKAAREKRCNA